MLLDISKDFARQAARRLKKSLAEKNTDIKLSFALDLVAKVYLSHDWNTFSAKLDKSDPMGQPENGTVERWQRVLKYIFGTTNLPSHRRWTNLETIYYFLYAISNKAADFLLPSGGWDHFRGIKKSIGFFESTGDTSFELLTDGHRIFSPKSLSWYLPNNNVSNGYFWLELNPLEKVDTDHETHIEDHRQTIDYDNNPVEDDLYPFEGNHPGVIHRYLKGPLIFYCGSYSSYFNKEKFDLRENVNINNITEDKFLQHIKKLLSSSNN